MSESDAAQGYPEVLCRLHDATSEIARGPGDGFIGPAWLLAGADGVTLYDATSQLLGCAAEATIRLTPAGINITLGDLVFDIAKVKR